MAFLNATALTLLVATSGSVPTPTTKAVITPVRDITGVGQTKPPSRDASPTSRSDINRRSKNEKQQDSIAKGICIGCSPK
jgi:hypothetical protein